MRNCIRAMPRVSACEKECWYASPAAGARCSRARSSAKASGPVKSSCPCTGPLNMPRTGVCLSSGWPDTGSVAGLTSASTPVRGILSGPVHGHEALTGPLAYAEDRAREHRAPAAGAAYQHSFSHAETRGIARMQFRIRFDRVRGEPRRFAGARQGVPVIAHPPGIEHEGILDSDGMIGQARRYRDETRLAARGEKSAVAEQARRAGRFSGGHRPLHGLHALIAFIAQLCERGELAGTRAALSAGAERGMLAEHVGGAAIIKRRAVAHVTRYRAHDPPIGLGLARRRIKSAQARN